MPVWLSLKRAQLALCALVGVVRLAFRQSPLLWFITAAGLLILPRLFEGYAPVACG